MKQSRVHSISCGWSDDMRVPLSDRKAALSKLLRKSGSGIQYVAHCDLDGQEAFAAACELGIEGIVKAADGALQVRAVQKLDQGAKSEVAGQSEDHRRDVLASSELCGVLNAFVSHGCKRMRLRR
jgi:hypothetical protein